MSCSIRIYTTKSGRRRISIKGSQTLNLAIATAIQGTTQFVPEKQMEGWWFEAMDDRRCFNTIPFNVEVVINRENLNWRRVREVGLRNLVRDTKKAVEKAIRDTGVIPEDMNIGVFVQIPVASSFQFGEAPTTRDPPA